MSSSFQFSIVPFLCDLRLFVPSQEFFHVFHGFDTNQQRLLSTVVEVFEEVFSALKRCLFKVVYFSHKILEPFQLKLSKKIELEAST